MKKIIICAFVAVFFMASVVNAQQARFGFSGGTVLSRINTKVDNQKDNSDSRLGFTLGVMGDVPLGGQFSFQPALNFLQKGGKETQEIGGTKETYTVILNYLEVPFNFVFRSKGEKGHFIAGLGPVLSYGISGKAKYSANGQTNSETLHFGDNSGIKAFEFGGNIQAGYESSNGILVTLGYNTSLSNLSSNSQSSFKNNYFGLRIGYLLSRK